MVTLNTLSPKKGSKKRRMIVGKGLGSGKGKTCGRGHKGQMSRSGNTRKESKEGGQMPLVRRIPKSGFSNVRFSNKFEIVSLDKLAKHFKSGSNVEPKNLKEKGIIKCDESNVKILGNGKIDHALNVNAHAFSGSAKTAIEKVGGKAIVIGEKAETKVAAKKVAAKTEKKVKSTAKATKKTEEKKVEEK